MFLRCCSNTTETQTGNRKCAIVKCEKLGTPWRPFRSSWKNKKLINGKVFLSTSTRAIFMNFFYAFLCSCFYFDWIKQCNVCCNYDLQQQQCIYIFSVVLPSLSRTEIVLARRAECEAQWFRSCCIRKICVNVTFCCSINSVCFASHFVPIAVRIVVMFFV